MVPALWRCAKLYRGLICLVLGQGVRIGRCINPFPNPNARSVSWSGNRAVRGGGFETNVPAGLTCDQEIEFKPDGFRSGAIGFRCCRASYFLFR